MRMAQRKTINLIVAVICLFSAVIMLWETLVLGVSIRTVLAVVTLLAGVMLLRRWHQGNER
jgi:hypothetical protein